MPNNAESSFGTSGSVTKPSAAPSPVGSSALKASLVLRGITTSLTSGWPSRETCTKLLLYFSWPPPRLVIEGRLAVDQTPITAFGSVADDGRARLAVSIEIGTSMAIEWTLYPASASSLLLSTGGTAS